MLIPVLKGLATYVPGLYGLARHNTGGTNSARYCYSVWLRHLINAWKVNGGRVPGVVAEIGPGDSLGIGLAALLSGAGKYFAFDVLEYADNKRNLLILDEIVALFRGAAEIPSEAEFPRLKPPLDAYAFPSHILPPHELERLLAPERVEAIRSALMNFKNRRASSGITAAPGPFEIRYVVPWSDPREIAEGAVDMIYSQAAMEHVEDAEGTYAAAYKWLKPGGIMSNQVDLGSHGIAKEWNGHWAYSGFMWRVIKGRRPYLLNRLPHSAHLALLKKAGFAILRDQPFKDASGIGRTSLAACFSGLTDEDLVTSGFFIQAGKP
jgi:SAM-dependent methyltransferase